jgi:orotidine-5'-phosphate decarboxylase
MEKKIILPLDNVPFNEALEIMDKTAGIVWGYKLRRTILEEGVGIIEFVKANFGNVMVDFKLYDIPSAMSESLKMHFDNFADISTVHCTAGFKPEKHGFQDGRKIAGVSILTSMDVENYRRFYKYNIHRHPNDNIRNTVSRMLVFAENHNYEYFVCSAAELKDPRIQISKIKFICPGIRPEWYQEKDDQVRTMTPKEAVELGADLLVIGRPLLNSENIIDAINKTNEEIFS